MPLRPEPSSLGGLPIQIDYTTRDFSSIRDELLLLATKLNPLWTDREPSDIGVTILEAVAYLGDVLSYGIDRAQNESYLASAQTREAVVDLLRLIGYELSPASPATVGMIIRTNLNNVLLPSGFTVRTDSNEAVGSLSYQLNAPVLLGALGSYCVSYELSKAQRTFSGETFSTNDSLIFTGGSLVSEGLGVSNGEPDQSFLLSSSPVCLDPVDGSAVSLTVNGNTWEGKTSFLGTEPTSEVFVYKFLSTEEVTITFGDGVNGKIPTIGGVILVSYRIDGGAETNRAGVGSIIKYDSVIGVSSVYNLSQPSGGVNPESVETAKKNGPLSLRALDRAVTLGDFETIAKSTPSVGVRSARASRGDAPIEVNLYVATEGNNPIPTGRWYSNLNAGWGAIGVVGRYVSQRMPVPTKLEVIAPTAINPYFEAIIHVYPNMLRDGVEFGVELSLQDLFSNVTDEFGEGLPLSAVIQAIENTQGVDYLDVTAFHRIPSLRRLSGSEDAFDNSLMEITGINIQTRSETYRVVWLGANTFKLLTSSGSYVQTSLGADQIFTAGIEETVTRYISNPQNNQAPELVQFSITITTGATVPQQGDLWDFSLDDYLGNIDAKPHEIIVAPIGADGNLLDEQFNLSFRGGI